MGKLKFKAKVLYSVAGIGDSALYNIMGSFALFFLTTIAGVHPAAAGTITAVGSVWNTLCGVVNGYVSDNLQSRAGKRKPFLLAASIPLMLFTSLFFLNIDTSETFKVLYYTVMIILFWTAFSMFFVPYLAWGAELTDVSTAPPETTPQNIPVICQPAAAVYPAAVTHETSMFGSTSPISDPMQ